jgi:hypothetical protein
MDQDTKNLYAFVNEAVEKGLCFTNSHKATEVFGRIFNLAHNMGDIYVPQDPAKVKELVELAIEHAKRVDASPYDKRFGYTLLYPNRVAVRANLGGDRNFVIFDLYQRREGFVSLAEWLKESGHEVLLGSLE